MPHDISDDRSMDSRGRVATKNPAIQGEDLGHKSHLYDPLCSMDIVHVFILNSCYVVIMYLNVCRSYTLRIHSYSPCVFIEGPRHTDFFRIFPLH